MNSTAVMTDGTKVKHEKDGGQNVLPQVGGEKKKKRGGGRKGKENVSLFHTAGGQTGTQN